MAYHKSAKKRIRSSETRRVENRFKARTTRNAVKEFRSTKDKEEVKKKLPEVVAMLDKLAKKKVIHKNKASNLKSKLARKVNAL
ncbi:MAG: 30S ribosomal protein S20 [Bacteroidota bacterium]